MNFRGSCALSNGALGTLALMATLAAQSCSSTQRITKIGERTYRIECEDPLSKCLAQVERPCVQGFKVLEGSDERRTYGVEVAGVVNEKRLSKAVVRCRSEALVGGGDDEDEGEEGDDGPRLRREPTASPAAPVCVAGATQACIGVGGCAGGQSCLLDGTAFSPCQCALPAKPEPVPSTTTSPSASSTAPAPSAPGSAFTPAPAVPGSNAVPGSSAVPSSSAVRAVP